MEEKQRMKNDRATIERREMEDKVKSNNRDRNDASTYERRVEADKTKSDNRDRNDETTANRREIKDANKPKGTLAIVLLALIVLGVSSYLIFY